MQYSPRVLKKWPSIVLELLVFMASEVISTQGVGHTPSYLALNSANSGKVWDKWAKAGGLDEMVIPFVLV